MIDEKDIAEFFKLFSNDGRLKIISSLATDNLTVNEIVERTKLSQSLVSQQLKLLKNARILTNEKIGKPQQRNRKFQQRHRIYKKEPK